MWQQTLGRECRLEGVGLHTGAPSRLTLRPAEVDAGLSIVRRDVPGAKPIPADARYVVATAYATSLGHDRWRIDTLEHLLAALYGCGIDNLLIEIDGPEVPILDGSALPFVEALERAGVARQGRRRRYHRLRRAVEVAERERSVRLLPAERLELACTIGFPHPSLRHQHLELEAAAFRTSIAPARTFGFLRELEALRGEGLIRGGTLENALVMGERGWVNPERVRFADEPVRHKMLDALGDLALFGGCLVARYEGHYAGHRLNVALVRALLEHPEWLEVSEEPPAQALRATQKLFMPSWK